MGDRGELGLDEVRQRHVFEEEVEELLARQAEPERVLALAVVRGAAAHPLAAALRPLDLVAGHVLLVAREHAFALAALPVLERRLVQVARGDRDARVAVGLGDLAPGDRARHRFAHLRTVALQKALRVDRALVARVFASVDYVRHALRLPRKGPARRQATWPRTTSAPAGTTRRAGAPASACSPWRPSGRRSSGASCARLRTPWR